MTLMTVGGAHHSSEAASTKWHRNKRLHDSSMAWRNNGNMTKATSMEKYRGKKKSVVEMGIKGGSIKLAAVAAWHQYQKK